MNDDVKLKQEDKDTNGDLTLIFDNFLKPGRIEEEKEIVKGFKIKVKVLNTGELLVAESVMSQSTAPADIVARVRAASILSQAIISLNGAPIERNDFKEHENRIRRAILYKQLLQMPAIVIHKAYSFYIECVNKQNSKYEDMKGTMDEIENF